MDRKKLLAELKQQIKILEADLLERAGEEEPERKLQEDYEAAKKAQRIAMPYKTWLDRQVTQTAVAWVLGTVFLRFCEDNGLIEYPYLAASGQERRDIPADRQHEFYGANSDKDTDRDWILEGFDDMSKASKVTAGLFNEAHNPMWQIMPSHHAAKGLVEFWRLRGEDGELVHEFTDSEWDTHFLGDLYQDLSEEARKVYALLQTPKHVVNFILDMALKPAIDEFGLEPEHPLPQVCEGMPTGLRIIDPACGSGHFLLGAFERLLAVRGGRTSDPERWELVSKVLYGIHGVDKNPFAVAIARFRLLLAAMRATGAKMLKNAPNFPLNVAVGDSLLHGRGVRTRDESLFQDDYHTYITEDVNEERFKAVDLLGIGSYHVVVGNPPYTTPKDKGESESYRDRYATCHRQYSQAVPFAERFFRLAIRGQYGKGNAGFVAQITANSFMKREFGKKLIEDFFRSEIHFTHVIDTSGAFISGHGTPTVILIGRNNFPRNDIPVRTVRGIQGEPRQPKGSAPGLVWNAILEQVNRPGSESQWISVDDIDRLYFSSHPWSLSGGGADYVQAQIEKFDIRLKQYIVRIGFFGMTHADEAMLANSRAWKRSAGSLDLNSKISAGEDLRDWAYTESGWVFLPYNSSIQLVDLFAHIGHYRRMWPQRTELGSRTTFSGTTYFEEGRPWYGWHQISADGDAHCYAIAFAEVATHNHFVLDRGENVFKQTAPVIKLPGEASEDDYLELLGLLNSSTACFWLKQVSQNKGNGGIGGGISDERWEHRYQFGSTKVQEFPLPPLFLAEPGRRLDSLARELASIAPSVLAAREVPTRIGLDEARSENVSIRGQMIAAQEELDWGVYSLYGLLDKAERTALTADFETIPEIKFGERAFEILLARKMAAGESTTEWFSRHGSTPITEIPSHWPVDYQELVQRRIDCIEKRKDIALIERPEHKRRWSTILWEKREREALRCWLLDACEDWKLWFAPDHNGIEQPRPLTVNQLADKLRADPDVVSVAALYAGPDADLAKVLADIIKTEHVPYLAALRYMDSGMRTRTQWEKTWELQREEDRTGTRIDIPVPPKYASGDFRKTSYWRQRGKLDVPKERFISYPGAAPDTDSSLLIGWAGWDHRQAAHALTMLIHNRAEDGWGPDRLTPLLAGLAEQLPWVHQWHGDEIDPELGMTPAQMYTDFLSEQQERFELSDADLAAWRPPAQARRRKSKKQ